jgi:hypothetical protein
MWGIDLDEPHRNALAAGDRRGGRTRDLLI